ncbi:hypothetical protein FACS1894185_4880 [Betaproteobacteria bacterium]|nr:hypothetical protein FACS1894185_4880 [Betaproteobacteria bacterium]
MNTAFAGIRRGLRETIEDAEGRSPEAHIYHPCPVDENVNEHAETPAERRQKPEDGS